MGAELAFKRDFPNCSFVGADPTPKNGEIDLRQGGEALKRCTFQFGPCRPGRLNPRLNPRR